MRNQYFEELMTLVQQNPDLPIMPMVYGGIAGDSDNYWLGIWGMAKVDDYIFCNKINRVLLKDDEDMYYVLECFLSKEEFKALPQEDEECLEIYDKLPWTKAIIVYINDQRGTR